MEQAAFRRAERLQESGVVTAFARFDAAPHARAPSSVRSHTIVRSPTPIDENVRLQSSGGNPLLVFEALQAARPSSTPAGA